ncbi:MAG: DUF2914 domain-containing protein [Deltaproteobacteria bacterium]|nr:DUF2914 domain-containing protein [Deltaproteobacteria bacterium]
MPDSDTSIATSRSRSRHRLIEWLHLHQERLWWFHSLYALILGIGIMWLGKRNFSYLRLVVFHISFIWLSSLFLPKLLNPPRLPVPWTPRLRLLVNFFNKNLYQQMLFFVLPIYYASATRGSRNFLFVLLVALSATLSTLDVVYDRHLSVKRGPTATFFAFNLFTLINVMLPILWSVSNTLTTRVSAALACLGFLSFYYPSSQSKFRRRAFGLATGLLFFGLIELGRPLIPPAPLRLASVEFGGDFDKAALRVVSPLTELQPNQSLQLYGVTAIKAPLGLTERVRHRWYENGTLIFASPFYNMVGGREEGFRLWTSFSFKSIAPGTKLRLDLETEGGQLIGRAELRTAS